MKTQDAIEFFGSRKAIADALGIWPQSVYNWDEEVPRLRAYQLREIMDKHQADVERQAAMEAMNEEEFERRCAANEEERRMIGF
jgi:DNA-binding transcriptional regulator YdaS (Cro superfamily)